MPLINRAMLGLVVIALVAVSHVAGAVTPEDLVCPVREDWSGDPDECPCQRWKPAPEQLEEIQEAHRRWNRQKGWRDPTVAGRAILCNVVLKEADLQNAKLRRADLRKADLRGANLQGAGLGLADLQGAYLTGADLQGAALGWADLQDTNLVRVRLQGATLTSADLRRADLKGAMFQKTKLKGAKLGEADLQGADLQEHDLQAADLSKADLRRANLQGANLYRAFLHKAELELANLEGAKLGSAFLQEANLKDANLQGTKLGSAVLQGADLRRANLQGAKLGFAALQEADLEEANLQDADLGSASLRGANLRRAVLQRADLRRADLQGANLLGANVEDMRLAFAGLSGALYAPDSPSPHSYLTGISGLATVEFPPGEQIGLVQLRELLQKAGLRDVEREATYAIEHGKALHARDGDSLMEQLGGWLQLIAFEWTTGWGLYPGRALLIILALVVGMAVVYTVPIAAVPAVASDRHGIFRVWPRERLEPGKAGMTAADEIRVERLFAGMPMVFAWALYFSMLSAFQIGWRELNVGTWLSRIQPTEFTLRGRGWVRVVSGLQSLISVYLVAMWVLTYFGRPFQ